MKNFMIYSAGVQTAFENAENLKEFKSVLMSAAHRDYSEHSEADTKAIINAGFDKILGFNYKEANVHTRRQGYRRHTLEIAELIEDVIIDKMVSGWNEQNAFFKNYVETVNLAEDNKAEWFVEDNSLLVVSKYAGGHHDINFGVRVA